jgi:hypothetical protein
LKPAFDGQDSVTPVPGMMAQALAEPWQIVLDVAGVKGDPAAAEAMYAKVLKASQCRATRSTVEDNEFVDDQKIAKVDFSCQLADLGSVQPLFLASLTSDEQATRARFTEAYTKALQSGPRKAVTGTLTLYTAKDKGYWYSSNFDDLVGPVLDALAPFDGWMQDVEAAKAPKVTGVPACDLLLQQHRSCVAKIAPDQISGVDAMTEELKAKTQVMSAEEMTQECKALRPMAEMRWTDECACVGRVEDMGAGSAAAGLQ